MFHFRSVSTFSILLVLFLAVTAAPSFAIGLVIRIGTPPPPLPVYAQVDLPAAGYIWVPGYWAWSPRLHDFYWVTGAWVHAPRAGYLWTPPWWGWESGQYVFHDGYWGRHVGFYGGIPYGFGYDGMGYFGGRWEGGDFLYNSSVNRLGNVHVRTFARNAEPGAGGHISFNGGPGGIAARPRAEELRAAGESHLEPTAKQIEHKQSARTDTSLRYSANHGSLPASLGAKQEGEAKREETHTATHDTEKKSEKSESGEKTHEKSEADEKAKEKPKASHVEPKHPAAAAKPVKPAVTHTAAKHPAAVKPEPKAKPKAPVKKDDKGADANKQ